MAVDPANRVLATASEDKTVRIWELPEGRLIRTISALSKPGPHGKIYALAISPDGSQLAFAGYTGQKNKKILEKHTYYDYEIYIHDLRSGRRLYTLDAPGIVDHLSWSAKGDSLMATISEMAPMAFKEVEMTRKAMLLYLAPEYRRIAAPPDELYAAVAAFHPDRQFVAVSKPGGSFVAEVLDQEDFHTVASRPFRGNPSTIAVSPDGSLFAVTTLFSRLSVHTMTDLSAVYQQDYRGSAGTSTTEEAEHSAVAWSLDGKRLYFGGRGSCGKEGCAIRAWETGNWASHSDIVVSPHRVTDLAPLKGGGIAFGTAGPAFGVIDAAGRLVLYPATAAPPQPEPAKLKPSSAEHWTECSLPTKSPTAPIETVRGKALYIDKSGAVALAPPFDDVAEFSGGLARVRLGGKAGYIDRSGRLVVPAQFELPSGSFSEGRAWVKSEGLFGYIDPTGKLVIPAIYESAGAFSGGLARVRERGSRFFGYINTAGEQVIPPKFALADDFHEGVAAVQLGERWGYLNTRGEWVIPPRFDLARRFSEGLASVRMEPCTTARCTEAFIDGSGAVAIEGVRTDYGAEIFSEGLAIYRGDSGRYGFLDKTGRSAIAAEFERTMPFSAGFAAVSPDGRKWGYINRAGAIAIAPKYEWTMPFAADRARFLRREVWGYLDTSGREVIPARFVQAGDFSEGLAPVCVSAELLSSVPVSRAPLPPVAAPPPAPVVPKPEPPRLSEASARRLSDLHASVASLLAQQRCREALAPAREALDLVERELARDDAALIQPLRDLGRVHRMVGHYQAIAGGKPNASTSFRESLRYLERGLSLLERHRGANPPEAAAFVADLADVQASLDQFDLALDWKQRQLAIAKADRGANGPAAARAANDLELLRVRQLVRYRKDFAKALPMAFAQMEHAEASLGRDDLNVARGLSQVAIIYGASEVGVRSAALKLHEQVRGRFAVASDVERYEALDAGAATARLLVEAGHYAQAERIFERVAAAAERALGADDTAIIELVRERGFAARESGQYEKSAEFFARAVAYYEQRLKIGPGGIGGFRRNLESLAGTYRRMGEFGKAGLLYQRLLDTREDYVVMNRAVAARVMTELATVQRLRGDAAAAQKGFESVMDLVRPDLTPPGAHGLSFADVLTRRSLEELAALALATNHPEDAKGYLLRAAPLDDGIFWFAPLSDRDALNPSDELAASRYYHQALLAAARPFRDDAQWRERAFDLLLNRKAITLDLQAQTTGAGPPGERARRNREELAAVRGRLANLMVKRPASMTDDAYAGSVTTLFERALALERELPERARSALRPRPTPVRKASLTAVVGRGTALVEFVRVRDEDPAALDTGAPAGERAVYLAFVLDGTGKLSLVEIGAARAIDISASDLQAAIRGGASPELIHELLKELYERAWAPLESLVGSAQRIVVSPDGELYRVPFAALVDRKEQFLIERFRFAYTTSGRDLIKVRDTGAKPALDLALVADPNFGEGGTFRPLPGTAVEARLIPPLTPGGRLKLLVGNEATETAVKQIQSPRVLHIATHGFFLDQDTFGLESETYEHSLVKSGLALAGANLPSLAAGSDDGLLTALEVTGMDLRATELVVLSSCDSGTGSVTHGRGVLGLRRAFELAGASSLLLTLWPVDDAVTAEVMLSFYRNLSRMAPADALHEAQVAALGRIRQKDRYANPSLWAAFLLQSGNAFLVPVR